MLALIGSNGAGKTTLVNLISGLLRADEGQIIFRGEDVTRQTVHERIGAGIARSFQLVNLFDQLSALDNVALSIFSRQRKTRKLFSLAEADRPVWQEAMDILHVFRMETKARVLAGGLSQGERKLLDVAIAYALKPKLLFLDEPTSGVSTREKAPIMDTISAVVRSEGISAAIIEHDMDVVFSYSDRIVAMHQGAILADGTPDQIRRDERVLTTLIGTPETPRVSTPGPRLELDRVETYRGPAQILRSISLTLGAGESVCLVGRNGAGKTTTIDTIMGLLPARSGAVRFQGRDVTRLPAHQRARLGIGYAPEDCGDLSRPHGRGELPDHRVDRPRRGGRHRRGLGVRDLPRDQGPSSPGAACTCRAARRRCSPSPAR